MLIRCAVQLNVDQRFADDRRVVDVIVQFGDFPVVTRGDRHIRFVRLNFADFIELFHQIADIHVPKQRSREGERAIARRRRLTILSLRLRECLRRYRPI